MAYLPSSEQVAMTWIRSIEGIDPAQVATRLPADPATWAAKGFIQVSVITGAPEIYTPVRGPVVQVDCWANTANSQQPPWGKASTLAERILFASYARVSQTLAMPDNFYAARLMSVYPISEPRRIEGEESGYARLNFDMTFRWVVSGVNP